MNWSECSQVKSATETAMAPTSRFQQLKIGCKNALIYLKLSGNTVEVFINLTEMTRLI